MKLFLREKRRARLTPEVFYKEAVRVLQQVDEAVESALAEIDAGDKFVLAQDGWEERKAAERKALERICGLAPETTSDFLFSLWREFDAGESDEARFAKAIDRSMPVLLNLNRNGGSWIENESATRELSSE